MQFKPLIADSVISIHALRKESDISHKRLAVGRRISIHALRKESDGSSCEG